MATILIHTPGSAVTPQANQSQLSRREVPDHDLNISVYLYGVKIYIPGHKECHKFATLQTLSNMI